MSASQSSPADFTFAPDLAQFAVLEDEWTKARGNLWIGVCTSIVVFATAPPNHTLPLAAAVSAAAAAGPSAAAPAAPAHPPRILLVRRAACDTLPGLWETPGGGVDPTDPTILHGAARELHEEAGLRVLRFLHVIATTVPGAGEGESAEQPGADPMPPQWPSPRQAHPGIVFTSRSGRFYCRLAFIADVSAADPVRLNPAEHDDFTWATEAEVRAERIQAVGEERDMKITTKDQALFILTAFQLAVDRTQDQ